MICKRFYGLMLNPAIFVVFLAVAFYAIFIAYSDFDKLSSNIEQFKFEFLPLILLFSFLGIIVLGFRQNILLKTVGIQISVKENILLYLAGLSMIITPVGAGQAIKSYYLKKKFGCSVSKTVFIFFSILKNILFPEILLPVKSPLAPNKKRLSFNNR